MERARRLVGAHRDDHGGLCHHEIRAGDHQTSAHARRRGGLRARRFRRNWGCRGVRRVLEQIRTGPWRVGDHPDGRQAMNMSETRGGSGSDVDTIPNGPGAAAILAAGIGCAAVGILAFAGDASDAIGKLLNFYNPTGALSGVTTAAIIIWLVSWFALNRLWGTQTVPMAKVNVAAFALLAVG